MNDSEKNEALVITDVSHWFGEGENRKQVLYNNCLTLEKGEIVVLTGPSGSGKTTLLTLIGALRSIQEGSISIRGREISGLKRPEQVDVRRNIGFIFQAHNLFDALTARQNVKMALELTRKSKKEQLRLANEILIQLGLEERITYKPAKLSGGQRQRVAIGRALVNRPPLVLADEPTAALDKDSGAQVLGLLRKLAEENGTIIIIVSHDARLISSADRIVNMVDGHIVSDICVKETMYICQFLKACSLFEKMSVSDLTDVAQKMKHITIKDGEYIIKQGEVGDQFYLIKEGSVKVLVEKDGKTDEVAVLDSGQFFGEVALLKEQPRNATIQAKGDVKLFSLSKDDFLAAVQSHQSFERQLFGALSVRS